MEKQGQNNKINVGNANSGNVAGGDINITKYNIPFFKQKNKKLNRPEKLHQLLLRNNFFQRFYYKKARKFCEKHYKTWRFCNLSDSEINILFEIRQIYRNMTYAFLAVVIFLIIVILGLYAIN